ncbi:MAG: hypothetical protein IJW78_00295 [Clostridia bacterium]|nr:hypothetical protein [Clostridia bacterium]
MKRRNIRKIMLSSVVFVLIAAMALPFFGRAENVVIESETNPTLTLENIHNPFDDELPAGWPQVSGNLTQENGKYTVSGDGYNCWGANDSVSFAYKRVNFNYGKEGKLTLETQLDNWSGVEGNSAGGMMLRSSLDPNAACIFLQIRPAQILYTYRSATGYRTNYDDVLFAGQYPVKFKMVLTKSKVQCYYQTPADSDFVALGEAVPFGFNGSVYVGLACYSMEQGVQRTASYTGFSYLVEAPEGTQAPEGGEDGTSSEENEELILPDDMNLPADVLLRETFTDNSMTEGKSSVVNPIWETNNVNEPDIVTNAEKTNRYLNLQEEDFYYLTGDEKWTDYEMSVDLTFPEGGYIEGAENAVAVHVRLTSIAQYGYASYVVRFINGNTVELGWFQGASEPLATSESYRILQTLNYDYKNKADVPLHLTMRAFDNHITVYLREGDATESVKLFDYEDLGERTIQVKTEGRIAIATCNATVHVDNIKVVKLEDLLGGDYDNRIQGLWDEEVPKYIQEFIDSKFAY